MSPELYYKKIFLDFFFFFPLQFIRIEVIVTVLYCYIHVVPVTVRIPVTRSTADLRGADAKVDLQPNYLPHAPLPQHQAGKDHTIATLFPTPAALLEVQRPILDPRKPTTSP